jgi:hypothetical protein
VEKLDDDRWAARWPHAASSAAADADGVRAAMPKRGAGQMSSNAGLSRNRHAQHTAADRDASLYPEMVKQNNWHRRCLTQ